VSRSEKVAESKEVGLNDEKEGGSSGIQSNENCHHGRKLLCAILRGIIGTKRIGTDREPMREQMAM
jgi:hypothetical protein